MPQSCPVCWRLNYDQAHDLIAALICGESLYVVGKRFKFSAMAVSRHWNGCMVIDKTLRQRSLERGPHRSRRWLLRAAPPVYAAAIKAWLTDHADEKSRIEVI